MCSDAQAVTAANAYVTVSSSTYGVEDIVPVGADFYVTTRNVGKPSFRADISVRANSPYYLVIPANGRMNLGIGESGLYMVKDESGNEDVFPGRVYVLKLDIEPVETNVCWKASSCTLKLTDDSYPGGTAVWSSVPAGIGGSGNSITFSPNALTPGEYTVTARSGIVANYTDTCIVRIVLSGLIIFVDQPGAGRDRDPYEFVDGKVDPGHTFWMLTNSYPKMVKNHILRYYINKPIGYYPKSEVKPLSPSQPGQVIIPDYGHWAKYEVSHFWGVSIEHFIDGLNYSKNLHNTPGAYDLNDNNCTDAAIRAGVAVGVTVPDTQGIWPNGGGSNAGDLGEDLRNLK